jgi:ring-1,2-phenylacetyl-CoA epoxidase subunit PaaC
LNIDALPRQPLLTLLLSLADDELVLGHRDSEWTGYAPILEEDIAFSNIAQDELGHSLVWYSLHEHLTGQTPDAMAFDRDWRDFTCCRFVSHPKGDFAFTVVRQYLFDAAEQVRLAAFMAGTAQQLKDVAAKIIREESYHLLHSRGLVERLGDATEESHRRMQAAVDAAFPLALGLFESIEGEEQLVREGVFPGNNSLRFQWLNQVVPVLQEATLNVPVVPENGTHTPTVHPDDGGRKKKHPADLKTLIEDLQSVYRTAPGAKW